MLMIAAALMLASSCTKDKSTARITTGDPTYCYHCTRVTAVWEKVPAGYTKPIWDTVRLDTCGITDAQREKISNTAESYPTDSTRITTNYYCPDRY